MNKVSGKKYLVDFLVNNQKRSRGKDNGEYRQKLTMCVSYRTKELSGTAASNCIPAKVTLLTTFLGSILGPQVSIEER